MTRNERHRSRGNKTGEQGNQGTVGSCKTRAADLAAEHGQLVAQDEDTQHPLRGVDSVDAEERKDATGKTVEERQCHGQQDGRALRPWSNRGEDLDPSP